MATTQTRRYGIVIQLTSHQAAQVYRGWDATYVTRREAEQLAARANRIYHAARVVEVR